MSLDDIFDILDAIEQNKELNVVFKAAYTPILLKHGSDRVNIAGSELYTIVTQKDKEVTDLETFIQSELEKGHVFYEYAGEES